MHFIAVGFAVEAGLLACDCVICSKDLTSTSHSCELGAENQLNGVMFSLSLCARRQNKTAQYDAEAMRYLSYALYPLVIGYAIYALLYESHRSWYSWILNSLVGAVYTFGFILMCPQVGCLLNPLRCICCSRNPLLCYCAAILHGILHESQLLLAFISVSKLFLAVRKLRCPRAAGIICC